MFSKVRANFLTGTLIVIPLIITFWILYFIIDKFNFLLLNPIIIIVNKWVPIESLEVLTKIIAFFLLLGFLTIVGFATRIIILRNVFVFGEKMLCKVPMINIVYKTIKEISFAFWGQKNTIFKRVILMEYPRKGIYQLGFVVSQTKGDVQKKIDRPLLNVFVPTSPNPTSGMLVFVPSEDTIPMDMSVAEGMKMVISGGAVVPKINHDYSEDRRDTFKKKRP